MKKVVMASMIGASFLLLGGCLPDKIQKQIDESENNVPVEEQTNDKDGTGLSDEQNKVLDELEKNKVEDAINNNTLEERNEVVIEVPEEKEVYMDQTEFSQYISYLYFSLVTGKMDSDTFYDKISPHFHEDFISLLPKEEQYQRETFSIFQNEFRKQVARPVAAYTITEVEVDERTKEGTFFRVYTLENKEKLYYMTYIKPDEEKGNWLLVNDTIAPPYKIPNENNETEKEVE